MPDRNMVLDLSSEGVVATYGVFVRVRNSYYWPSYDGQKNLTKFGSK